jgi:hypothetical protein
MGLAILPGNLNPRRFDRSIEGNNILIVGICVGIVWFGRDKKAMITICCVLTAAPPLTPLNVTDLSCFIVSRFNGFRG